MRATRGRPSRRGRVALRGIQTLVLERLPTISAKTPLSDAIRDATARIKHLRPYLEHGFLEIDNSSIERAIRPIALRRNNYIFMGSLNSGNAAAIAYTLIESAKLQGIAPKAWLAQVLERMPGHSIKRVYELLRWNSSPTATPNPDP